MKLLQKLVIVAAAFPSIVACATAQNLAAKAEAGAAKAEATAEKAEATADKAAEDAKAAEAAAKAVAATDDPVAANKAIVDGALLVDGGTAEDFAKKHHPTAINAPAADVNAAVATVEKAQADKAKGIVVYTTDGAGCTALRDALKAKGYTSVWAILGDTVVVPDARAKAAAATKK
jgi:rhodanese-related sulfurtransferase